MRKSKKLLKQIVEDLRQTPVIESVCHKHNISRQTFYRWRNEDVNFLRDVKEAIELGDARVNDMCKSQLISSIQKGNMGSVKYWLSNKDPDFIRPRKKHPADTGSPLPFNGIDIRVITEKQVPDDPEEEDEAKENIIEDDIKS